MDWFHYALLALACAALLASWNVPRCRLWVFALAGAYIVSVAYYRLSLPFSHESAWPHGAFIAFAVDAAVFVLIRETHKDQWEIWGLGSIMIASATLNAIQMMGLVFGWPPMLPQATYSTILEIANVAFLILIIGRGILGWIADASTSGHHLPGDRAGGLARAVTYAHEACTKKTTASQPLRKW